MHWKKCPVDAYIATDKGEKQNPISLDESERKLTKADFTYHKADNTFTCPGGQTLNRVRKSKDGDQVYQGSADICASCIYQSRCCESKKGEARTITTDDKEPLRQEMNAKMATQASKDIYSRRKVIVEPVLASSKIAAFEGLVFEAKKKLLGSFPCFVPHTISKKLSKPFLRE